MKTISYRYILLVTPNVLEAETVTSEETVTEESKEVADEGKVITEYVVIDKIDEKGDTTSDEDTVNKVDTTEMVEVTDPSMDSSLTDKLNEVTDEILQSLKRFTKKWFMTVTKAQAKLKIF